MSTPGGDPNLLRYVDEIKHFLGPVSIISPFLPQVESFLLIGLGKVTKTTIIFAMQFQIDQIYKL